MRFVAFFFFLAICVSQSSRSLYKNKNGRLLKQCACRVQSALIILDQSLLEIKIKKCLKALDESQYEVFRKLAVGKDIRESLRRDIPIGKLTYEQMNSEVIRLEALADQATLDAVASHDALMQEIG